MPDNVAVHDPSAWVIRLEANNCPSRRGISSAVQQCRITSNRVGKVKLVNHGGIKVPFALAEDGEVVTVKMYGMGRAERILNDEVDPGTSCAVQHHGVGIDSTIVGAADGGHGLECWLGVVRDQLTCTIVAGFAKVPTDDGAEVFVDDGVCVPALEGYRRGEEIR